WSRGLGDVYKRQDGYSVAETCEKSGFNDYTNFVKAFTKAVGISPKKYGKYSAN
ncbi:MAG: helix-turn-helix domain-containing protein, partial [Oscillospiraceae bacterium]|nr:helix-turn-helix domain-containing protein [Oscillospiraceae bacterium]